MPPDAPFILLDDARADGVPARLYRAPVEVVTTADPAQVAAALDRVRAAAARGLHAAGFLAYEAGAVLGSGIAAAPASGSLLWFGLFDGYETLDAGAVAALLPDPAGAWAGAPVPVIDEAGYAAKITRILDYIRAGDIYQANLTFQATVAFAGDPLALYARLRAGGGGGYGGIVATGDETLLSFSPELFFRVDGGTITARPMKGTAPRGATPAEDTALARTLADDAKQRAENLMIVDLMRNDIARVAVPGSVAVPHLFEIEHYPTVHQMTSTVTATLAPGITAGDALVALFPCGSITGAPKIRASQVIAEVEGRARGAYTGTIGRIDATGDAAFNVAIRTLHIARGATRATLGLGSGIVADSVAAAEWAECRDKGAFVTAHQRGFDLIETMAFDPDTGIAMLDRHLARMKASADTLGFAFDRHAARNDLQAATFRLRSSARVRMLLARGGQTAVATAPLPPTPDRVDVAVVPLPVEPHDFRLRHKTTDRAFYDTARTAAGMFEVVFVDRQGWLTEGSFTTLFVARAGRLLTPPLAHGVLPGVLRAALIESGRAVEERLRIADLAQGFYVGNALRGLIAARLVADGARAG